MKLPNFRLYETQAIASLLIGLVGLACLGGLAVFVLWGFNTEEMVILYSPKSSFGKFRVGLVYGCTAISGLVGGIAAILGFRSLGQKRNTKQGFSWLGLAAGAFVIAVAPVLLYTWRELNEPLIL